MAIAFAFLIALGAVLYAAMRALRAPRNAPERARLRPRTPGRARVVCLGDSLTQGTVSFDWVAALAARCGQQLEFVNAGVNGDLAYNALARMDDVVACAPDVLVVFVGVNDVCGAQTPRVGAQQRRAKRLPRVPSLEFYASSVRAIFARAGRETRAQLIAVAPPLLGEDLGHPVHAKLLAHCEALAVAAQEAGAVFVPLHQALEAELAASGHPCRRGFELGWRETWWLFEVPLWRYLLGGSYDALSAAHGLRFSPDLIHLNERAGALVLALLEPAIGAAAARATGQARRSEMR